jgi:hypothetical protein
LVAGEIALPDGVVEVFRYESSAGRPAAEVGASQGGVLLTAGEALGFAVVAIFAGAAISGAARVRGGRIASQTRGRPSVEWHRILWLAILALMVVHGAVQIASGHWDWGTVAFGSAAFTVLVATVWLNAYRRDIVRRLAWRRWLAFKLGLVALAVFFAAVHIVAYGRHFVG